MLGTTIPLLLATTLPNRMLGARPTAHTVAAGTLLVGAAYIALNETFANWQALWLCAGFVLLAVTLLQVRDAPG
jgi:glucan 1,3-beta-glucosidase